MADPLDKAVRHWMFEEALPFWAEHGVDRAFGGYVEQLTLDGLDAAVDFKRTRVICRQIYVFSHAALLGYGSGAELARHGYLYLTEKAWLGPDRGWARLLDRHGRMKDATPDLYDLAFVLFALGWYFRLTGDSEAKAWAMRTLDFIETRMRHPGQRGYLTALPASGHRKQNPHMHLLEAALANLEACGDERFLALADEMVGLFCDHFYDGVSGTLGEYFDESWRRAPGEAGRAVEPGHHFEWAWLLLRPQGFRGGTCGNSCAASSHLQRPTGWIRAAAPHSMWYGTMASSSMDARAPGPMPSGIQAGAALFELDASRSAPVFRASRPAAAGALSGARAARHLDRSFAADGAPYRRGHPGLDALSFVPRLLGSAEGGGPGGADFRKLSLRGWRAKTATYGQQPC